MKFLANSKGAMVWWLLVVVEKKLKWQNSYKDFFIEECNNCQQERNPKMECTKIALEPKRERLINNRKSKFLTKVSSNWMMVDLELLSYFLYSWVLSTLES